MFSATTRGKRVADSVVALRQDPKVSVETAAEKFLAHRDLADSTKAVYRQSLDRLAADVGPKTPIRDVDGQQLVDHMQTTYTGEDGPTVAAATWNRHVATISSLLSFCVRQGWIASSPAQALERHTTRRTARQRERSQPITYEELAQLWTAKRIDVREKALWRFLYDTAARAAEALSVDVEDLDLEDYKALVVGKGGNTEAVYFGAGTARLLYRLVAGRETGPLFVTHKQPTAAKRPAQADLDPSTGRARLSYRRAAEIFREATNGRWRLHQLRHSRLSHLAEDGVDATMLAAKSRHRSLRTLECYVQPSDEAVGELTARHDPDRRHAR